MKRFFAAISFLTRLPVPQKFVFEAADVGRSTVFFPLVGALIGLIQTSALLVFVNAASGSVLKAILLAVLLVVINVFVTGALHLDGLADMADGFGGGREKERTLEIMRDSLIGSYGAVSLILLLILKVGAVAALIENEMAWQFLILAPALGRWASVPLGKFMPYARKSGGLGNAVTDYVGWRELVGATIITAILLFALIDWQTGLKLWLVVTVLTIFNARLCFKKIGGVTGDTLGANTEICETAVLLAAVFLK
jgi:cobalamin 5'-phosphate synthase/cobalamin synthase